MPTGYLRTILLSFYSAEIYRGVNRNWHGFGLKYLLVVTLITSAIVASGWAWTISKIDSSKMADTITGFILYEPNLSFDENITRSINILSQIPEIKIENGKASTIEARPYKITDPVSGEDVAIIDTSGEYKSLEDTDALLLLTETKLITLSKSSENNAMRENVLYLHELETHHNTDEKSLNEALYIMSQIPPFGLRHGRFITEEDKIYKIMDTENHELAQVGSNASLNEDTMEPMLAISSTEIAYKSVLNKEPAYINTADLNEQYLFELIESGIKSLKKLFLWGVPLIAFPFVVLTSFAFSALMLVLYAFIGHSFVKMAKIGQFEYKQIMRLSAVAMTPVLIISTLLPQVIPSQGTVYFLIAVGYLYFAIRSVTAK